MRTWTKLHEKQLQAGRKQGLHPALSERENILLCSFDDCTNVAWEEFKLPVCDRNSMSFHVFCSPNCQARQLYAWGES